MRIDFSQDRGEIRSLNSVNPASYKFAYTDTYIKSILDCGSKIVYRLGATIERPGHYYHTMPPADYDKWGDICIQVIRHYNEGWANGFNYGIEYWEIWNEPENGPGMWDAPYEEYIKFYIQTARRIKAACPGIKIGGPAFNGVMLTCRDTMHKFLSAIKQADAPLDFCSWHAYPEFPEQLPVAAKDVRRILDEYGYTRTESHLNEWNLGPLNGNWYMITDMFTFDKAHIAEYIARKKGPEGAALVASSLIALQDAPLDMANYYDATVGPWGMFDISGLPCKVYYAFIAFHEMLAHTPLRCHSEGFNPNNGIAALAGRSRDGKLWQILACNFQAAAASFPVELTGLPAGEYQVEHRRLDNHSNLELAETFAHDAIAGRLEIQASPRTVQLYTFKRK